MQTMLKAVVIIGLSALAIYALALWAPWPGRYQIIQSMDHLVRFDTATGGADVMKPHFQKRAVYWDYRSYIPPAGKGEWAKYAKETEGWLKK